MSFGSKDPHSFLDQLKGRLVTFLVDDRASNLRLARFLVATLASSARPFCIFDVDAFYASNSDSLAPLDQQASGELVVPDLEDRIGDVLVALAEAGSHLTLILDNLNSVLHIIDAEGQRSANRKLEFTLMLLSSIAKERGTSVLCVVYERQRAGTKRARWLSGLGDARFRVTTEGKSLLVGSLPGGGRKDEGFLTLEPIDAVDVEAHVDR